MPESPAGAEINLRAGFLQRATSFFQGERTTFYMTTWSSYLDERALKAEIEVVARRGGSFTD